MRTFGKIIAILAGFLIVLFFGFNLWLVSKSSVSVVVHLRDGAAIKNVRVSLCGKLVRLVPINHSTYRYDTDWIFSCGWQELGVDILGSAGKVRHHQLCYYDGLFEMNGIAEVAPDKLVLKCRYGPSNQDTRSHKA